MKRIIAVLVDEENRVTDMKETKKVLVFNKQDQKWSLAEEINTVNVMDGNMATVRKNLENLIKEMKDCRIIVGKTITGLVFNAFNQAGFIISEIDEFHEAMLDSLYADIIKEYDAALVEKEADKVLRVPVETDVKGNFFFDFSLLKNSGSSLSSKAVLRPFLNDTPFNQLEILCDHFMPWLELELKKRELDYTVTEIGSNKYRILIKA